MTTIELKWHVSHLHALLLEGSMFEQRTFLKSFIRRIAVDYPQVTVEYTVPLIPTDSNKSEVLCIGKNGGLYETTSATGLWQPPNLSTTLINPKYTKWVGLRTFQKYLCPIKKRQDGPPTKRIL